MKKCSLTLVNPIFICFLQKNLSVFCKLHVILLTLYGHLLQICNVSSLFIRSLWSFQSRLSMSADLQRLNICFYFGNTFVMLFIF